MERILFLIVDFIIIIIIIAIITIFFAWSYCWNRAEKKITIVYNVVRRHGDKRSTLQNQEVEVERKSAIRFRGFDHHQWRSDKQRSLWLRQNNVVI